MTTNAGQGAAQEPLEGGGGSEGLGRDLPAIARACEAFLTVWRDPDAESPAFGRPVRMLLDALPVERGREVAGLREAVRRFLIRWDDVATVEPESEGYVEMWSEEDSFAIDEYIEGLRDLIDSPERRWWEPTGDLR